MTSDYYYCEENGLRRWNFCRKIELRLVSVAVRSMCPPLLVRANADAINSSIGWDGRITPTRATRSCWVPLRHPSVNLTMAPSVPRRRKLRAKHARQKPIEVGLLLYE